MVGQGRETNKPFAVKIENSPIALAGEVKRVTLKVRKDFEKVLQKVKVVEAAESSIERENGEQIFRDPSKDFLEEILL